MTMYRIILLCLFLLPSCCIDVMAQTDSTFIEKEEIVIGTLKKYLMSYHLESFENIVYFESNEDRVEYQTIVKGTEEGNEFVKSHGRMPGNILVIEAPANYETGSYHFLIESPGGYPCFYNLRLKLYKIGETYKVVYPRDEVIRKIRKERERLEKGDENPPHPYQYNLNQAQEHLDAWQSKTGVELERHIQEYLQGLRDTIRAYDFANENQLKSCFPPRDIEGMRAKLKEKEKMTPKELKEYMVDYCEGQVQYWTEELRKKSQD